MNVTAYLTANALRDFEFIHANGWDTTFVKYIAASRIDQFGLYQFVKLALRYFRLESNSRVLWADEICICVD
jgi:hypothetical protein